MSVAEITPENPIDMPLVDLVGALATAKVAEELAKERRIDFEERVAAKIVGPPEGQKTITLEDGTKVTVTRGFNFKADCESIRKMFRREGFDHAPPVASKTTLKLDIPAYKKFAEQLPSVYRRMAEYVTVTQKKTAVEIRTQTPKA
jgi:hypothetical protein